MRSRGLLPIDRWDIAHYCLGMSIETDLIKRIEKHCRDREVSVTTFGRKAVNDGKLITRLRSGKAITTDTIRKIEMALKPDQARAAS